MHIGARRMTAEKLKRRLKAENIVTISAAEWAAVAGSFEQVECRDTFVAGDLLIVRSEAGLAVVEQPSPEQRVVRRLSDDAEASRFVQRRLEEYERMWDGCGCKVDYYS
jgi:hypothetical protein